MANGATIAGSIPPTVYYMIDQSARNWLNLSIGGIDAQFDYTFDIGDKVNARFGASGTHFENFDQNFGENPVFSVLNTSGFNGVFSSVQFKGRAYGGVDVGKFSADLFWNHIGELPQLEWQHRHPADPGCQRQSEWRWRQGGCH